MANINSREVIKNPHKFQSHWTGYYFHEECTPPEEVLDKEAKSMGPRPKDISDSVWNVQLMHRKREIVAFTFPNAKGVKCAECSLQKEQCS